MTISDPRERTTVHWLYLLLAVIANASANIAFKKLALAGVTATGIRVLTGSPWFWLAGISCIAHLAFYVLALKHIELGLAYACVTAGALILISVLSIGLFGSTLGPMKVAGITAVAIGIVLLINA